MRKDLGKQPAVFPMPVLMVAAYDENGTVQVMNAAWGMILIFDQFQSGYSVASEKVGQAWNAGKEIMKLAQDR